MREHTGMFTSCKVNYIHLTKPRYQAPEVEKQAYQPIEPENLFKCDVWAFGLLVWEVLLDGQHYLELPTRSESDGSQNQLLKSAKASLKLGGNTLQNALLLAVLNLTLQDDPAVRVSGFAKLPIMAKWQ